MGLPDSQYKKVRECSFTFFSASSRETKTKDRETKKERQRQETG